MYLDYSVPSIPARGAGKPTKISKDKNKQELRTAEMLERAHSKAYMNMTLLSLSSAMY